MKKNWKKLILSLVAGLLVIIVISVIGIFLWTKTWKTFTFPNNGTSVSYPGSYFIMFKSSVNNFGNLVLESDNKDLKLTIDTFGANFGCGFDAETCIKNSAHNWVAHFVADPEKDVILFDGGKAYLFSRNTTDGTQNFIVFYNKNVIYSLMWIDNSKSFWNKFYNQTTIDILLRSIHFSH